MSTQNVLFDAPGPKAVVRHRILTILGVIVAAGVLWIVLSRLGDAGQLEGRLWEPFVSDPEVWTEYLIQGLINTIKAAVLSVIFAGIFGIVFGMGRLSEITWIRWTCGVVVEFFRSVPVLLMMIFFFFGYFGPQQFPTASTASLAAVVLALTLYNGSVIAELVRSGVHALPAGQGEAGLSIGLTPAQTLRSIQLPQALTAMLPALISQFVVVLKDTALGVQITYPELLNAAKTLGSAYGNTIPAYVIAAVMFILLNYALTKVAGAVERRLKRARTTAGPVTGTAPNIVQGDAEPGRPTTHGLDRIGGGDSSGDSR